MKVRKLAVALALAGGLGSGVAHALGMGEGRILTNLNEPLRAEIELRRADDVPQEQIRVSLASEEDFDRAGINKMHFLRQLDFELTRSDDGQLMIEVSTDAPVREPFLNFLVDVTWPSGRVMRQYAFLVDPPERPDEEEAVGPEAEATDTAEPEDPGFEVEADPEPEEEPEGEVYGPTASNDRLWNIAGEYSPSDDLTRQQVMLAIQDLNPDAFVDGNINRLRQGHVLRLPSEEQARTRSANAAVQEVMAQNEAFETPAAPEEAVVDATDEEPEEEVAAEPTPEPAAEADDDELRIVTAEGDTDAAALAGNDIGNGEGELSAALEELDRVERDRDEMSERVEELEEQVETMEQLLELKDDQLAEMQQRMEEIEEREAELAEREARLEEDEEDTADVAAAPEPDEPAPEEEPVEPDPAADEDPVPTSVGGFVDRMVNDTRYQIGAGAIALALLGLLWGLARRNAAREEAFYEQIRDVAETEEGDDVLDLGDEAPGSEDEGGDVSGEDQPGDDALAEADVYMAYGRSDQAAQHLEEAISREPSRSDLRVKLLEAYAHAGDSENFEKQYRELSALGDEEAVQQADALRDNLAGDTDLSIDDLAEELKTSTGADDEDAGDFSLDDDVSAGSVEAESESESDLGIEWDLDETSDLTDTTDSAAEEPALAETESEQGADDFADLGFSLDDLELEDDSPVEAGSDEAESEGELSEEDLASLDLGEDDQPFTEDQQEQEPVLDAGELDAPEPPATDEVAEDPGEAIEFEAPELDSGEGIEKEEAGSAPIEPGEQLGGVSEEQSAEAGEAEPESPSAEEVTTAVEADEFDESFLDELDAELEKVTEEEPEAPEGPESPEAEETPEPLETGEALETGEEPESLDDLELDVSDEDLALMEEVTGDDGAPQSEAGTSGSALDGDSAASAGEDGVLDLEPDESEDLGAISEEESLALQDDDPGSDESASSAPPEVGGADLGEVEDTDLDDSILEQAEATVAGESEEAASDDGAEAAPDDDEFDFLEGTDEAGTKLDLARAYVEMGDADGARDILEEVAKEGSDQQKEEAQSLLKDL